MYPIADLTAFCRRTSGDVPPKLVGASTTVVGSKMYLYGGRLVAERKMVSDIYMFDLEALRWERLEQSADDDVPQARYFHSADAWNNYLIIFGGMAIQLQSDNPEDLCVLNDVRLFDLATHRWLPSLSYQPTSAIPKARYAHLSSVTANRLFVIGGQDLNNVWLDDVHVYDLQRQDWVVRRDYPRHCGTYRSVAVASQKRVRLPQEERRNTAHLGAPGTRFNTHTEASPAPDVTQPDAMIHLPYSCEPSDDFPCDVFLFSNYNFTDVQRELEVFSPLPGSDFTVSDRSTSMTGTFFPPGLRFPSGAVLGTHFIVAGTYLSQSFQSFSIWALDLVSMTWSRIDPGSTLSNSSGSWFRSCLWADANKYLVFGNRHGSLVEDYNRRLLSWEHVIVIDLEAFGIYQPPPLVVDIPQQELGLAALEEGVLADFEIVCDDGRKIKCSRKLLEDRWPWFKKQRTLFLQAAARAIETVPSASPQTPLPDVHAASDKDEERPDPRLTPRTFHLSEPYPITLAFIQYLYSMALLTPLQHAPAVLSQLLLLSSTYDLPHLQSLVKHAMHRALTFATSVGIYGVSTLCNCRSLQIRALRVVMAYSQKRPSARNRADKDGSGGGGRHQDANGGSGSGGSFDKRSAARPRGLSDASYMQSTAESSGSGVIASTREYSVNAILSDSNLRLLLEEHKTRARTYGHRPADSGSSSLTTTGLQPAFRDSMTTPLPPPPSAQAPMDRRQASTFAAGPGQLPHLAVRSSSLGVRPETVQLHVRSGSVLSMATEEEIASLTEILLPAVDSSSDRRAARSFSIPPVAPEPTPQGRIRTSTSAVSYTSSGSSELSSLSPELEFSEGYYDSNHLSASPASVNFHLPRFRQRYLSDTPSLPSLATSESHSIASLSTPPLSRTPSVQFFHGSSPVSPSSASPLLTPVDTHPTNGLGIIHERNYAEEDQIHARLERALTFDEVVAPETMMRKRALQVQTVQQPYPQQTYPQQQAYNQQMYNQQAYAQEAYTQEAYTQQAHPQQVQLRQAYPQQAYPQQAYPQQAYSQPGTPQSAYPEHGSPQSAYPYSGSPQSAHPQQRPQPGYPLPTVPRPTSPETIVPAASSVWSAGDTASTTPSSNSSQQQKTTSKPFSKLFSKNRSNSSSTNTNNNTNNNANVNSAGHNDLSAPTFTDKSLEKAAKAEEKRFKKQEAKERRERLAIQFQSKEIAKQAAADAMSDGSSSKRKKPQWEEDTTMYDGLAASAL